MNFIDFINKPKNTTEFNPGLIYTKYKKYKDMVDKKFDDLFDSIDYYSFEGNIIYISGPATGIDNYESNFKEVVSFLESDNRFEDDIIVNPMEILKEVSTGDYIADCFITLYILDFADIIILDDRTDLWKNSRGVLIELTEAINRDKEILSLKLLKEDI